MKALPKSMIAVWFRFEICASPAACCRPAEHHSPCVPRRQQPT